MVMVQLRLIQAYRRVPFGVGWWAFSFSYAAAIVAGIDWLAIGQAPGRTVWIDVLLAIATTGIALLVIRTIWALRAGSR
jgi:tellurite resistance protein